MSKGQSRWKQDFFAEVEEIRLKDPLSYILGAMDDGEEMVFCYTDAVKMAGHSCAAVSGAYKVTLEALKSLYGDDTPVRGDIKVTIKGKPTDLAYGPMSQVISLITGAAPETGFHGLGGRYGRYNLLNFDEDNFEFNTFIFERIDTGKKVKVVYNPQALPESPRMGEVAGATMSGSASEAEREEFFSLWQGKVKKILLESDDYPGLLEITELS
ncbi:MAG: hypothetical protein IMF07_03070 [Proteobacteria bacterium]|nr:hypothetical protein [Pseudomonadota bacterium]